MYWFHVSLLVAGVYYVIIVGALDGSEVFGMQNENCTPYLTHRKRHNNTFSSSYVNGSVEMECPPWYCRDPDRYDSCKAGKDFSSILFVVTGGFVALAMATTIERE